MFIDELRLENTVYVLTGVLFTQKQLQSADYGTDLPSVQTERDIHQREHKQIDQFHSKVDTCIKARQYFNGEELVLYNQHLSSLQKIYAELLSFSNNRLSDLDSLLDFIQSATNELHWLNEKEEIEVSRDWSDKNLNVQAVEKYYEVSVFLFSFCFRKLIASLNFFFVQTNYGSGCEVFVAFVQFFLLDFLLFSFAVLDERIRKAGDSIRGCSGQRRNSRDARTPCK